MKLLFGRLVIAIAAIVVPLFLVEAALRIAGDILPGNYQTMPFIARSNVYGWTNVPNQDGWIKTSAYTTRVQVNSKGLRGPERDYAKDPGVFRIMVLGDSFTFAAAVPDEQSMVSLLPDALRENGSISQVETINAGVDGWGTLQELAWLQNEGYKYEPDLIVLMFYVGNDPANNLSRLDHMNPNELQTLGIERAGRLESLRQTLAEHSRLYSFFEYGVLAKLNNPPSSTDLPDKLTGMDMSKIPPDWQAYAWTVTEAALGRLRDYADSTNTDVVVVGIPTAAQVADSAQPPTPLPDIVGRIGLPLIDLLPAFRAEPQSRPWQFYLPRDLHWTADGQALAARVVGQALLADDLVPFSADATTPVSDPTPAPAVGAPVRVSPSARVAEAGPAVTGMAFSPDGKLLVLTSRDGSVRTSSMTPGTVPQPLARATGPLTSVALSPDGTVVAAGAEEGKIWLWRTADGSLVRILRSHSAAVTGLAFSADGEILVSGSADQTAQVWRVADGKERSTFEEHSDSITGVAISPDGKTIVSGSDDGTVRVWRPKDAVQLRTIDWGVESVSSVAFAPDNKTVAAGAADGTVTLWSTWDGPNTVTIPGLPGPITGLVFAPDGQTFIWAAADGIIRQARASDGALLRLLEGMSSPIRAVAVSPDGTLLAGGTADGMVHLWSLRYSR